MKAHRSFVFAACLLIAALILVPVQIARADDYNWLPNSYDVTKTVADLASPYTIFDYTGGSPTPDNYSLVVVFDARNLVLDTQLSGHVRIQILDNSIDTLRAFEISYNNDGENFFVSTGNVDLEVGSDIPDAYISVVKIDNDLTIYDSSGNLVSSDVVEYTNTVGYAVLEQDQAVSGSVHVEILNSLSEPSPSPSPSSSSSVTSPDYHISTTEGYSIIMAIAGFAVAVLTLLVAVGIWQEMRHGGRSK